VTLHQLRLFVAVSQYRNITKASSELYISQPAVSRQMKLLAEECRVRLYRSHGRGIELTTAGRSFLNNVKPLLDRFDELEKFGAATTESKNLVLTIGGSHTPSAFLLPSLVSHFKKSNPNVRIVLRCASSRDIEKMVLYGEVEIAFITAPSHLPKLFYKTCREDELVVFAPAKHPLTMKQCLSLEELSQTPLVVNRERSYQEPFLVCFRERGLSPNIAVECDLPQMVIAAVKTSAGVGILIRDAVDAELKEGVLRIIKTKDFKVGANTFATYERGALLSTNATNFLRLADRQIQKLPIRTSSTRAAKSSLANSLLHGLSEKLISQDKD